MFRYPRLSSRTRYEVEDVLELYKRAGFFNNFSSKFDEEDKLEKIKTDWNNIKSAEHHHTADYCLEQSGKLAGTSSLAQFCQTPNLEYWVFHQLCADKELTTLEDTGTLYNWRCEYLHLRKKDSASYVWFRSESRWLERIYVKFNTQNPQLGELKTCSLFTYIHHASEGDSLNVRVYNFGDGKRAIYKDDYITAGAGPNYVHINRNMNVIICNDGDWTKVKNAANKICQALNEKSLYFRVEIDNSNPDSSIEIEPQNGTDRVTIIKKVGLLDLIPCVNHSIAVTKLKKGIK